MKLLIIYKNSDNQTVETIVLTVKEFIKHFKTILEMSNDITIKKGGV